MTTPQARDRAARPASAVAGAVALAVLAGATVLASPSKAGSMAQPTAQSTVQSPSRPAAPSAFQSASAPSGPRADDPKGLPLAGSAPGDAGTEQWSESHGNRSIRNVVAPTLTPFLPDPATATGAAVIVAPGGGFQVVGVDWEGYEVARWFARQGVAAFVLRYRTLATPRDAAGFAAAQAASIRDLMRSNDRDHRDIFTTPPQALEDANAALRLVRDGAAGWGVDPHRIGFLGFSAGAALALAVGLAQDADARPDFLVTVYGPTSARAVPNDAPALFVAAAADDYFFGWDGLGLVAAYQRARRPVEAHLYERGGHGFAMTRQGRTSDAWPDQLLAWMRGRALLARASAAPPEPEASPR